MSIITIGYKMFISRSYSTFIIHVVSLSLNNYFNNLWKRCVLILHHLHKYEMLFSMAELPPLFKIAWILLMNSFFGSSSHICSMIFNSGLSLLIFQYGNTFICQTLLYYT